MSRIEILDCTLRDGGYVVDTKFGDNTISAIMNSLVETGIEIIECGFLRNERRENGSTVFSIPSDMKAYLPTKMTNCKYVLMFDAGKYDVNNLPQNDGMLFGIRDCFHKEFRERAFEDAKILKEKGYEVFIQPTGILQYSDAEILELIEKTNLLGAYSFAIVDTFGSMEKPDLVRLFNLIHHNLDANIALGFHSHNNQQLAYALSQDFLSLGINRRDLLIDTTVYGMGRGAGNACTESMAFHLNKYYGKQYDTEQLLDLIESQILQIYDEHQWGYSVRNFVAGICGCHVDNAAYLYDKGNLLSSDVKGILEEIPTELRIHFYPDILENTLSNYKYKNIDDTNAISALENQLIGKDILLVCPGKSLVMEQDKVQTFCQEHKTIRIAINFVPENLECEYFFFSNPQRLHFWKKHISNVKGKLVITSNLVCELDGAKVNYYSLVCQGKKYGANAIILCLKLLDKIKVGNVYFAGFDGYAYDSTNYINRECESSKNDAEMKLLNYEISEMITEYKKNMIIRRKLNFITSSRFEEVL